MRKTDAFNKYAPEYDEWFETHRIEYKQELAAVRQLIPDGGAGVEIGSGTGRFTQALNISLGIEPSAGMRKVAATRSVNVVGGVAEALPVSANSHNYAIFITTVCFLDEPKKAFTEVFRILKPGGYIIVGFINAASRLGRKYQIRKIDSKFYKNAAFRTVKEITDDIKDAGFGNFECIQATLPGDVDEGEKLVIEPGYGKGSFVVIRAQKPGA